MTTPAPVFEGDVLRTEITVDAIHPLSQGGMVDLHAVVWADRADHSGEEQVLDWRFIALMA